ncbi:hypothetical protein Pmani_031021 [Petrolisthes manimaculis]|uniref:Uncharacterized protein n=1 Tax=Petrolisthes manimaculis TaxID=1843537 RepID=A0AAE1NUH5_9EUCA|nr:hypothetical protein Pmani_031021 [Petrolisthes manimaculis]
MNCCDNNWNQMKDLHIQFRLSGRAVPSLVDQSRVDAQTDGHPNESRGDSEICFLEGNKQGDYSTGKTSSCIHCRDLFLTTYNLHPFNPHVDVLLKFPKVSGRAAPSS